MTAFTVHTLSRAVVVYHFCQVRVKLVINHATSRTPSTSSPGLLWPTASVRLGLNYKKSRNLLRTASSPLQSIVAYHFCQVRVKLQKITQTTEDSLHILSRAIMAYHFCQVKG